MDTLTSTENEASDGQPAAEKPVDRPLYRVQVGAFYNLQNAIDLEQELKRMGYNTWIVTGINKFMLYPKIKGSKIIQMILLPNNLLLTIYLLCVLLFLLPYWIRPWYKLHHR